MKFKTFLTEISQLETKTRCISVLDLIRAAKRISGAGGKTFSGALFMTS